MKVDAWKPAGCFIEDERSAFGEIASVVTVLLTNRECPWRCLMCDLWQQTLTEPTPIGAIPAQIDHALAHLSLARSIKLYNSGSFFDPMAIPPTDYPAIARRLHGFERVIVECHPGFVNGSAAAFRDLLGTTLEVAMGLETTHPEILPRLNKRMTLEQFAQAAERLSSDEIALRAFVLVKPPFLHESEAVEWAAHSVRFAFQCGATAVSLIPTRAGNGALEALEARGEFSPPRLRTVESALETGINFGLGRVFADLWDLERFSNCPHCFPARRERISQMNLQQVALPEIRCANCPGDV